MSSVIKIKRSDTKGSIPSSLQLGEVAVNLFDRKLYVGNTAGGVSTIGGEDFRLTTMNSGAEGAYLRLQGDSILSTNNVFLEAGSGIDITRQANGSITFAVEDSAVGSVLQINATANETTVSRTNGTVTVGLPDNVTIGNALTVTGNETVGGTLGVTGATTLSSTLGVTGATTLSNTLSVGGTSTLSGDVTAEANLRVNGDTIIDGNLSVEGALTYISTSTVYADDSMFKLSANNAGDAVDSGIYAMYVDGATQKYSGYFRDASDGVFKFYTESQVEPSTTVDIAATGYALAQVDAVIDGGSY